MVGVQPAGERESDRGALGEHEPGENGRKRWNHRAHRRTFLRHRAPMHRGTTQWAADLHFWAEWEPEAEVVATVQNPDRRGPRHVFRPYYVPKPGAYARCQNTDPFVFGDRFLYTGCQQHTSRGPTTSLKSNVSPGKSTWPSSFDAAMRRL